MSNVHPVDPIYSRAMKFAEQFQKQHPEHIGMSNLYVLQKHDQDGNLTGEYYGMNLMTDYGMGQYFISKQNWPTSIYFGNGSGSFNYTSQSLISTISTVAATVSDSSKYYNYPLYYSGADNGGIITTVCQWLKAYLPFVWDNFQTAITISEYGIGTSPTQLWTHSWVYNNNGVKTTITKTPQEQLTITVFFCMSYTEKMINDAWDAGRYILITNPYRFTNRVTSNAPPMEETKLQSFKRYGVTADQTKSNVTSSAFQDNLITIYTNMARLVLAPGDTATTGYVDGLASWTAGMNMLESVVLDHDVAFDTIAFPNPQYCREHDGYSYNFGAAGYLPFTRANVTASTTYNYQTGEWTCADVFLQTANKWYTETFLEHVYPTALRYINNNNVETVYVYRNLKTDDPIVALRGLITTVYATDKYWDVSSWIHISDLANVPAEARTKKYWISSSDSVDLDPVRASQSFEYIGWNNQVAETFPYRNSDIKHVFMGHSIGNYAEKWFIVQNRVYSMKNGSFTFYDLCTNQNADTFAYTKNFAYGNHIFFIVQESSYADAGRFFYYINLNEANPSVQKITSGIDVAYYLTSAHFSDSKNGYFMFADPAGNAHRVLKVDCTGTGTFTQTQMADAIDAACIMQSTNYAYIDATNTKTVYVKSLVDDSLVQTFTIPSSAAAPTCVFGWRDMLYVTDCSTYVYLCNTTTGTMTACTYTGTLSNLITTNRSNMMQTSIDECMIIYDMADSTKLAKSVAFEYSNPSQLVNFSSIQPFQGYFVMNGCQLDLKKLNTNTIVLIHQAATTGSSGSSAFYPVVYNFGKFLHEGALDSYDTMTTQSYPEYYTTTEAWVVYGNYFIRGNYTFPIANTIPHKLVGTTRSVTALDSNKSISNKQWSLQITNISSWNGKPPGTAQ